MIRAIIYYVLFGMITGMCHVLHTLSYIDDVLRFYSECYMVVLELVGLQVYVKGYIDKARSLWVSNHPSKLDGPILQFTLGYHGCQVRSIVKDSVLEIPMFGPFGIDIDTIFVGRGSAARDSLAVEAAKSYRQNKSVLVFPEGTAMSPENWERCFQYALQNNLPLMQNVLTPRITGVELLRQHGGFPVVNDVTIHYDDPELPLHYDHSYASLLDIMPHRVFINITPHNIYEFDVVQEFAKKDRWLACPDRTDYRRITPSWSVRIKCAFVFLMFYLCIITYPELFALALCVIAYRAIMV